MLDRRPFPSLGRVLAAGLAGLALMGLMNCAPFRPSTRDGILSAAFAPRALLEDVLSAAPGTYIDRILVDRDSTIERWSDHVRRPLHIWIDSSSAMTGVQSHFPAVVRAAFSAWAETGIPVRFLYVGSARDADVRIRWTDHLDHKTGSTTWRTDRGGWLLNSDITLATHLSDGHPLDARGMRAIALHEVGHALGLSHSTDANDIMAPLVRVDSLSVPDRSTIKLLYSLPAGHIR